MKIVSRIFLITGIVIFVIGAVIAVVGAATNSWNFSNIKYEYLTETLENATDLTVKSGDGDGNFITKFYDGEDVVIEYAVNEKYREGKITKTEENNYLFESFFHNHRKFGFVWFHKIPETIIKIPTGYALNIDFKLTAGNVELADGEYKNLTFNLAAGNIQADSVTAENLTVNLDAGNFQGENLTVTNKSTLDLDAGNFEIENLTCPAIKAKLSMGNFYTDKLVCDNVEAIVNMGNLQFNIVGDENDYTVKAQCKMGSSNIKNRQGNDPDKLIDLDVDMGNITVNFINL